MRTQGLLVGILSLASAWACSESSTPPHGAAGAMGTAAGHGGMPGPAGGANAAGASGMAARAGASASGGAAGTSNGGDSMAFVPEGLPTMELNAEGGLTLVALTLAPGSRGPELYAAVRNDGPSPACEAGMTVDFKDKNEQVVGTAAGTLLSGRFYRLDGGAGVVISCVAPDQVAMTAMTDLPDGVVIEALGSLEYAFPAFAVSNIVEVEGLSVSDVRTVMTASGSAFTGALTNDFSETLRAPKVTMFPLNRVGRPVGVSTSSALPDLAPGDQSSFQTSSFHRAGVDYAAFATATYPF